MLTETLGSGRAERWVCTPAGEFKRRGADTMDLPQTESPAQSRIQRESEAQGAKQYSLVMSKKNRVGIVITQLSAGGAERQVTLLSRELERGTSFTPAVFCLSDSVSPFGQVLSDAGVRWFYPRQSLGPGLPRLLWLLRSLAQVRCDLLYGILNVGNTYACAASFLSGIPFVASIRSANPRLPIVTRLLSAQSCSQARLVIANSQSSLSSLRRHLKVQHDRVEVIENGVEVSGRTVRQRDDVRKRMGLPTDAAVFCSVGRLGAEKRPLFFVDVFRYYHRHSAAKAHFVWQGSGPEGPAVEEACARLPEDERQYLHFLPESPNTRELLACSDVFLLTSEYEGMPNALLEAMAAGLPCVVTDVAGTRDVSGGSADRVCVMVPPGDPRVFAETLAELVLRPDRMAALGQRALVHVQSRFSVEAMVEKHVEAFQRALERETGH